MAPPKKGLNKLHPVGLTLTDEEIARVDELASSRGFSRAELLRAMVKRVLAAYADAEPLGIAVRPLRVRVDPADCRHPTPVGGLCGRCGAKVK